MPTECSQPHTHSFSRLSIKLAYVRPGALPCCLQPLTAARAVQSDSLMVHTPDCASQDKVRPLPWHEKRYNATLVGGTWDKLYPLRHTMATAIEAGIIHGAERLPHPGCAFALEHQ